MQLHDKQKEVIRSRKRFKVIRAGRKGGKTSMETEVLGYKATCSAEKLKVAKKIFPTGRKVIYIAPTQDQARKIIWEALKARYGSIGKTNEQQLTMIVPNEDGLYTTIYVGGWENRENWRGMADVVHITFDELDSLRNFATAWKEIFRPMFLDTGGTADFIGTPDKKSGNLRRLEKEADGKEDWGCFHFTSRDNPYLPKEELEQLEQEAKNDYTTFRQEILAEYIDDVGSLFKFTSIVDIFSNSVTITDDKYLIVDIADDGSDKTVFSYWRGLEEYKREEYANLNTELIVSKIREVAMQEQIPYSHIAVDAIGVGAGVASSSLLTGIIGFKSSYAPIKTDANIVKLPNVSYLSTATLTSDYKNLRSQCVFTLADKVNNHKIASRVTGEFKEKIIEELSAYQDASSGDGKRMATQKEDVKALIGRSPDHSDTFIMRMYFEIMKGLQTSASPDRLEAVERMKNTFDRNFNNMSSNSTR